MRKKNIYFYGCSNTAGDELADDQLFDWFPALKEEFPLGGHLTGPDAFKKYYDNLAIWFSNNSMNHYREECKKLAYPAIIESRNNNINCINNARSGAGFDYIKYAVAEDLQSCEIDFAVIQIPPHIRECNFTDITVERLTFGSAMWDTSSKYNKYVKESLKLYSDEHYAVSDVLDMYSTHAMLKSKGVPHMFFDIAAHTGSFADRLESEITSPLYQWIKQIEFDVLPVPTDFGKNKDYRSFAHHYNAQGHNFLASMLEDYFKLHNII